MSIPGASISDNFVHWRLYVRAGRRSTAAHRELKPSGYVRAAGKAAMIFFRFKAGPGASFAPPSYILPPMNCVGPRSRWRRTKGASLQDVQGRPVLPNYLPLCATASPPLPRTGASGLRFSYRRSAIKRSSSVVMLFPPLYQSRSSDRAEKRLGAQTLPESAAFGARTINCAQPEPSVHTHGSRP